MDRQLKQTAFVPLLGRDALRPLGHFRLHYGSPTRRDVQRRVEVSMGRVATGATEKLRLTLAVGFRAVPAASASAARIARVNEYARPVIPPSPERDGFSPRFL